jgi:GNAT superfamily N-acetyltransferase
MSITIRPATEADAPFLATVLQAAESSGAANSTYQCLFDIAPASIGELLCTIQSEELEGSELGWPNYLIAEAGGAAVAACAGWVEAAEEGPSAMIKASVLPHFVGADTWRASAEKLKIFSEVAIERRPGTIQLESFYVAPEWRGHGLAGRLIDAHIERLRAAHPEADVAQIQFVAGNTPAQKAYEREGFRVVQESWTDNPAIRRFIPGNGKVMVERVVE